MKKIKVTLILLVSVVVAIMFVCCDDEEKERKLLKSSVLSDSHCKDEVVVVKTDSLNRKYSIILYEDSLLIEKTDWAYGCEVADKPCVIESFFDNDTLKIEEVFYADYEASCECRRDISFYIKDIPENLSGFWVQDIIKTIVHYTGLTLSGNPRFADTTFQYDYLDTMFYLRR